MLFNSYEFIFLFLPVVFAGFFLLGRFAGKRLAIGWLVLSSFLFYGWWDAKYVPLLLLSILFNYSIGRRLEAHPRNKLFLSIGIVVNVLLLGYFKYTDFFLSTANEFLGNGYFDLPHIILPLGISFFTFTQTAYLVDAYRGETRNDSFLTYCEFVTIFPHLIAGPIISHKIMMPQFVADKTFQPDFRNIAMGIAIFSMGLFKKVAIADALAPWSLDSFSRVGQLSFVEAWIGALSYTFQLYFDFSGYSEMAIGLGLLFNLRLPLNFDSPYQARSIIDFWRRWHMTLGLWVKEYLYIPMGGNRYGQWRKMYNLFVSMLLVGMWHGAGWTYILWGGLHGIFLVINHQWRRTGIELPKAVNWTMTFLCVTIGLVIFRSENIHAAGLFLGNMCDLGSVSQYIVNDVIAERIGILAALGGILAIVPHPVKLAERFQPNNGWLLILVCMFIYAILHLNNYSEFLYFQF